MTIENWLAAAIADAEQRGLPEVKPLLETLARATAGLRRADGVVRSSEGAAPAPPRGHQ